MNFNRNLQDETKINIYPFLSENMFDNYNLIHPITIPEYFLISAIYYVKGQTGGGHYFTIKFNFEDYYYYIYDDTYSE
jgi:hypothetical protein